MIESIEGAKTVTVISSQKRQRQAREGDELAVGELLGRAAGRNLAGERALRQVLHRGDFAAREPCGAQQLVGGVGHLLGSRTAARAEARGIPFEQAMEQFVAPVSLRTASTVHRRASDDQSARTTL